jgi:hypothetical protein
MKFAKGGRRRSPFSIPLMTASGALALAIRRIAS